MTAAATVHALHPPTAPDDTHPDGETGYDVAPASDSAAAASVPEARRFDSFDEAFAAFHLDPPKIAKNAHSTDHGGHDYADLADVVDVVLPALARVGLTWRCRPTTEDGQAVLHWRLRHGASDDQDAGVWIVAGDTPQEQGSALTYARRQCLLTATGLAPRGVDDDGARASGRPAPTGPSSAQGPAAGRGGQQQRRRPPRPQENPEVTLAERAATAIRRIDAAPNVAQARGAAAWVDREGLAPVLVDPPHEVRERLRLGDGQVDTGAAAEQGDESHGDESDGDDPWSGQGEPGEPPL